MTRDQLWWRYGLYWAFVIAVGALGFLVMK